MPFTFVEGCVARPVEALQFPSVGQQIAALGLLRNPLHSSTIRNTQPLRKTMGYLGSQMIDLFQ